MDSRTAAHVLRRIGDLVQLTGGNRFQAKAYRTAARAVLALGLDDLAPAYRSGALAKTPGIGPATLSVLRELIEEGESSYLESLLTSIPEGLVQVARVPGLTLSKVQILHEELGIRTLDDLEAAIADGRLAKVRGFGPKTVARIAVGIATLQHTQGFMLFPNGVEECHHAIAMVARHPDVTLVECAGEIRRYTDVVGTITVVAQCQRDPAAVVREFANEESVRSASFTAAREAQLTLIDGTRLNIVCSTEAQYPTTLWRSTGSGSHVEEVRSHAARQAIQLDDDSWFHTDGTPLSITSEADIYTSLGLPWIAPELREGMGEVDAARAGTLPTLVTLEDVAGVLHCHSTYSDGSATIAEMAQAAQARGWRYLGISDHSVSAFYAGGMRPDDVLRQHDEIDALNETLTDFRVLKGIECDILSDGALDYDDEMLSRFDYVIGSIHSRFSMPREVMTARILTALSNPRLTILAHPTGRLLLRREPYAVDLDAVIERAAETGVALELNADPSRLDLDWRWCRIAKERGVIIEIGPDAHSTPGFKHMALGVHLARKGWLTAADVMNTWSAEQILARRR